MEKSKKPVFGRIFNLFDIILLVIIAALAVVLLLNRGEIAQESTVQYTVEVTGLVNGTAAAIKPGDKLSDKIKKYDIGTVVSVDVHPTIRQVLDYDNNTLAESESDSTEAATIVISVPCTQTESAISAGGYELRVGLPVNAVGPGYTCNGYIIAIDRSGE